MKTYIKNFILISVMVSLLLFSGCKKNTVDSGGDLPPSSEQPPIEIIPEHNVTVDVVKKEYGTGNGTLSDAIDRAYACVYELKAISQNSYQLGSAVAIFKGRVKKDEEVIDEEVPENTVYLTYFATSLKLIEGALEYKLKGSDGKIYYAEFIGADPNTDIAVLAVEAELPTVEFVDDSDKVRLGDEIFAIGTPFNSGASVVKYSILGAQAHNVQIGKANRELSVLSDTFNDGYVGGAVYVKNDGLFCGVIANITDIETDGYTFVVPSNVVLEISEALAKTNSSTSYGYIEGNYYLGATYEDSKLSSTQYVYISNIDQTGCLYLGGLRELDKITRIAYIPKDASKEEVYADVSTKEAIEEFFASIPNLKLGDTLEFKFIRGGLISTRSIKITQFVYSIIETDSPDDE